MFRLADRRRPPPPLPSCCRASFCCPAALTVPPPCELSLSLRSPFGIAVVDAATDDAPHANMVTMAPSPLVQNHVKNDKDMGNILAKKISVQLGLVCVDSMQRTIKSTYIIK